VTTRRIRRRGSADEEGSRRHARRGRRLLAASVAGLALAGVPLAGRAQVRTPTPRQTAGRSIRATSPPTTTTTSCRFKGQAGIAKGELLLLTGFVVDTGGKPVAGARVEILAVQRARPLSPSGRHVERAARSGVPGLGPVRDRCGRCLPVPPIKPVPYPGARRTSTSRDRARHFGSRHPDVRGGRAGERPRRSVQLARPARPRAGDRALIALRRQGARDAVRDRRARRSSSSARKRG